MDVKCSSTGTVLPNSVSRWQRTSFMKTRVRQISGAVASKAHERGCCPTSSLTTNVQGCARVMSRYCSPGLRELVDRAWQVTCPLHLGIISGPIGSDAQNTCNALQGLHRMTINTTLSVSAQPNHVASGARATQAISSRPLTCPRMRVTVLHLATQV